MKKILYFILPMAMLACTVSSCLNTNNEEIVHYDDAAITSASFGTLTDTIYTKTKDGLKDSTYTTTFDASKYKFYIDQLEGKIYNPDSLPIRTSHRMLVTLASKNSGYIYIKSLTSDTLSLYSSTDTIDFSQPRKIVVVANNGVATKEYTMEARIHKEKKDVFKWSSLNNSEQISKLADIHAICLGNNIIVYGKSATDETILYTTDINDGNSWTEIAKPFKTAESIITDGNKAYTVEDGNIYISSNGTSWDIIAHQSEIKHIIGANDMELYAMGTDGMLKVSKDNGNTWNNEILDGDASFLPQTGLNCICLPHSINDDVLNMLLIGNRSETTYPDDKYAVVWTKTLDTKLEEETLPWSLYENIDRNKHAAPKLLHTNVATYDNGLLMLGATSDDEDGNANVESILLSIDNGLTWHKDNRYTLPVGFNPSSNGFAMTTDSNNNIWIISVVEGQIWRGHLSHLAWEWK